MQIDRRHVTTFMQSISIPVLAYALINFNLYLSFLSIFIFILMRFIGSVVTYHRLVGHNLAKLPKWLETIFIGLGFYGSLSTPIDFCAIHSLHHKFVDTEKDPHPVKFMNWKVMFPILWKYGSSPIGDLRTVVRLRKNSVIVFIQDYYWFLCSLPLLLLLISFNTFFYVFLFPCCLSILSLSLSTLNHDKDGPKDMSLLFAILTCGEHKHIAHHNNPVTADEGFVTKFINFLKTGKDNGN